MSRLILVLTGLLCGSGMAYAGPQVSTKATSDAHSWRHLSQRGWLALRASRDDDRRPADDDRRPGNYDDRGGYDTRPPHYRGGRPNFDPRARALSWRQRDRPRFRGGIGFSFGGEILQGNWIWLGGVDGRLGVQINHFWAVYAQLHLSLGGGNINGIGALTGTFAATVLAEVTFFDRLFVGGGAGYGVLNNPHGPVFHLRFGGYPALSRSSFGARRKGFVMGVDTRVYVVGGLTVFQLMGTIGYEAF